MSGLYSVRMVRAQIISRYDASGKKIGEEVRKIPVAFNDLPHATAVAYQVKFPDAEVVITQQPASGDYGPRSSFKERRDHYVPGTKPVAAAPKRERPTPAPDKTVTAAMSGDLAEAINAGEE